MKTTEATTAVVYHALLIELFYDFREVREGSGKTVDLVNDYGIDSLGGDVSEKALESRPFNVTAGEAAIIIRVGNDLPALMSLAQDVSFTGLSLGIERIKGLL